MPFKFITSVRDPVYGLISLTECEQDIIQLPILARLRNIKQLGLAYLAFSGANHTRYEHSLGAMHVASLMCQSLGLNDNETQTIRIAALLHDVGHPPFSHSLELSFKIFRSEFSNLSEKKLTHEYWTEQIIGNDKELAKTVKRHHKLVHMIDIAKIATGNFRDSTFNSILSSPIDADKIDYILRDNHHCGFPVAVDINTITEILKRDSEFGLLVKPEGVSFVEQLLMGRYHLITKIHNNKTNRLGNYLLALSFKQALHAHLQKKKTDPDALAKRLFTEMNDYQLCAFLRNELRDDFHLLDDFLRGKKVIRELFSFKYPALAPMTRYNVSIISERKFLLPKMSENLRKELQSDKLFVDVNHVKLPDLSLRVFNPSGLPGSITTAPTVQGIINASLSWQEVSIYAINDEKTIPNKKKILDYYSQFDEDVAVKYERNKKYYRDESEYLTLMLIEWLLTESTKELRNEEIMPCDILLLILHALHDLTSGFKEANSLFFDGSRNFLRLVKFIEDEKVIIDPKKTEIISMKPYGITIRKGFGIAPAKAFIDIDRLVNFGMLYRKEEIAKFMEAFNKKSQLRISGWGRCYFATNLKKSNAIVRLYDRLFQKMKEYLTANEENVRSYLNTTKKEILTEDDKRKISEIRRNTLLLLTV